MAMLSKQEIGVACYMLFAFVFGTEAVIQHSMRALCHGVVKCAPGIVLWVAVYGWFFLKLTPGFVLFDNWQFFPGSYFMRSYGAAYAARLGLRFVPSELLLLSLDGATAVLLWYGVAKLRHINVGRWSFVAMVLVLAAGMASVRHSALARRAAVPVWALLVFPPGMFFIGCGFLAFTLYKLHGHTGGRLHH